MMNQEIQPKLNLSADTGGSFGNSERRIPKLNAIEPDTGIVSPAFVKFAVGTTEGQILSLKGFILDSNNPKLADSESSLMSQWYRGSFDTSGNNLQDAAQTDFVLCIEGPIHHSVPETPMAITPPEAG